MNIHTITKAKEVPAQYEYLPIQADTLERSLAELQRRWPHYDPPESWYLKPSAQLLVPADVKR